MRLADFLEHSREEILEEAAIFAKTLPTLRDATDETLRDHFSQCLDTISADLRSPQSRAQSIAKSQGQAQHPQARTAAEEHGIARANSGLTTSQLVSEYRALRSSVLRLWKDLHAPDAHVVEDLTRFNEAIDQALAESVIRFEQQVEHWRHIFLGVLGHDLRTPLNAMALTSEILRLQAPEGLRRHANVVSKGTQRIGSMLDSLLDYSNSQVGMPMPLYKEAASLCKACEDEVEIIRAAFPDANIEVDCEDSADGRFDISRMREALSNLVSNAVQHGKGQSVQVQVRKRSSQLILLVANQGDIPASDLGGIFKPLKRGQGFQTGHRTHLGLGLFICKQIAEAHDGDISAASAEGMVRITLTIPDGLHR